MVSPTELTMVMDQAYSPTWFQYNELSQITPMPAAWDRTASGPSDCASKVSDCAAVFNYLNTQSKDLSTYATSPIWSVVDGPWKLSSFNADGHVSFVPNKTYSGPVKPKLSAFDEVPFTTDAAEYDVLQSPSSSTKIDVGYLPYQDAPAKPANAAVGRNPLSARGYTLDPWKIWGINYYVVNYQSTTGDGPIFKQLYFREALAYLMNQAAVIAGPLRGYGTATVGPVPNTPVTSFLSPKGKQGTQFPYDPAKAKALLTSHGWTVVPNGVTTCADPAECGPGIKKGQGLSFNFPYATGISWLQSEMTQLQSNAAHARDQAEHRGAAVRRGDRDRRRQLRGHQVPVQLGHGELGRGLVVRSQLPADRRGAVQVRCRRELGRLLRHDQRRADRQNAHQQQPGLHVPVAGLPGDTASG